MAGTEDRTFHRMLPIEQTLDGTLGITYEPDENGRIVGRMPVENRVRQPYGIVHGGVYAAIAESMASAATYVAVANEGKVALGMSNQTHFLRPIREGTVHAVAEPAHKGRSTWVWDVSMSDDDGNLCAVSRVTIAVRPARPTA
jgi:uncharacterized protein (TIGR00369 family)